MAVEQVDCRPRRVTLCTVSFFHRLHRGYVQRERRRAHTCAFFLSLSRKARASAMQLRGRLLCSQNVGQPGLVISLFQLWLSLFSMTETLLDLVLDSPLFSYGHAWPIRYILIQPAFHARLLFRNYHHNSSSSLLCSSKLHGLRNATEFHLSKHVHTKSSCAKQSIEDTGATGATR